MTKPRTKTREELTAEIEQAEKKIRQYENKEKILDRKLAIEKRKERNHRLCVRGGFMESLRKDFASVKSNFFQKRRNAFCRFFAANSSSRGNYKRF